MELEKFSRQLRLMVMLTQNRTLNIDDICQQLAMSRRSVYRYLDTFKGLGFIVIKEGNKYRLDHQSPFFQEIASGLQFSDDEGVLLSQLVNSIYSRSPQVRALRDKLSNLYDSGVLARHGLNNQMAQNITRLFDAIRSERVVLLRNYNSPSSGTVSNRIVEPYLFINDNAEVRCYELATNTNKTFKVSRAERVELLDLLWSHKNEHTPFYNDLFGFTGDERLPVKLRLGQLSASILLEEYPDAQRQLEQQPDGKYLLATEVCNYAGIGRFVLGLYDDIEIVDSPEFDQYMKQRIEQLSQR